MLKSSKILCAMYKKIYMSFSTKEKFLLLASALKKANPEFWIQYLMQEFEKIDKSITLEEAKKTFNLIRSLFKSILYIKNTEDMNDTLQGFIQELIEKKWFEDTKFNDMNPISISKLLYHKAKQYALNVKDSKSFRDKSKENEFDETFQKNQVVLDTTNSKDWDMILGEFEKYLGTIPWKNEIDIKNVFENYFLEGDTLTEIAEDESKNLQKNIQPGSIQYIINKIGDEFVKFMTGIKHSPQSENMLKEMLFN